MNSNKAIKKNELLYNSNKFNYNLFSNAIIKIKIYNYDSF